MLSQFFFFNCAVEPHYNEIRYNKIFPIPRRLAIEFHATKSSPQRSICVRLVLASTKFSLRGAGVENLFYEEISTMPAICSFLHIQGAYLDQKRVPWAHTTARKQKLTRTWGPLFAGDNDLTGSLYTRRRLCLLSRSYSQSVSSSNCATRMCSAGRVLHCWCCAII